MFLIPQQGLTVIDPALMSALPAEGRDVGDENSYYWLRHIREGAVTIGAAPPPESVESANVTTPEPAFDTLDASKPENPDAPPAPSEF